MKQRLIGAVEPDDRARHSTLGDFLAMNVVVADPDGWISLSELVSLVRDFAIVSRLSIPSEESIASELVARGFLLLSVPGRERMVKGLTAPS